MEMQFVFCKTGTEFFYNMRMYMRLQVVDWHRLYLEFFCYTSHFISAPASSVYVFITFVIYSTHCLRNFDWHCYMFCNCCCCIRFVW